MELNEPKLDSQGAGYRVVGARKQPRAKGLRGCGQAQPLGAILADEHAGSRKTEGVQAVPAPSAGGGDFHWRGRCRGVWLWHPQNGPGRTGTGAVAPGAHDLKMTVAGTEFKTYIDGQLALQYRLPEPVSGKIGLWSKTDSTS
jgi:hypothetical protein